MTTEEKAKAYDEALERARQIKNGENGGGYSDLIEITPALTEIFPELRESEDERIWKAIIQFFRDASNSKTRVVDSNTFAEWATYLEKQKEQKSMEDIIKNITKNKEAATKFLKSAGIMDDNGELAEMYRSEQKPTDDKAFEEWIDDWWKHNKVNNPNSYDKGDEIQFDEKGFKNFCREIRNMYNKSKEGSEDYREEDIQMRFAFYTYKDDPNVLYLSNVFVEETNRNHGFGTRILKATEKVTEAIGATTIRLKVKQDSSTNAWYRKRGYSYMTSEDGYDWLEKNLKDLKSVKSVEWSEEDERMLKSVIGHLRYSVNNGDIEHTAGQLEFWLKSLHLQPHWKPEGQQLDCLRHMINISTVNKIDKQLVQDLYEQLEKQM